MPAALAQAGRIAIKVTAYTAPFKTAMKGLQKSAPSLGDRIGDSIAGRIGSKIMSGLAAVFSAASIGKFAKDVIDAGAEFEQAVGGIDVLFGESAEKVKQYAMSAYRTAGISATSYMEQATSFAAKLLKETGGNTERTAYLVNTAITDMSDNMNRFGTDIGMIQHAYEGLAKGNATMLDNLKIGYGGTKKELLSLVKDAGLVEASVQSFNDITFEQAILAIHEMQRQLGVTGTTAHEALTTWSGAFNMLRASFENFKATFGQGLIYLLQPVLQVIARISDALTLLGLKFLAWTKKVMGIKSALTGQKTKQDIKSIGGGIGGINTGIGNTGKAAKKTKKQVQDLKKELMGFDRITKLQGENGTSSDSGTTSPGSSGGGGASLPVDVELPDENTLVGSVKQLGKKLIDAWNSIDFAAMGVKFGETINSLIDKIDTGKIARGLSIVCHDIFEFVNNTIESINWDKIWDKVNDFVKNLNTKQLGEDLSRFINNVLEIVASFFSGVDWGGIAKKINDFINSIEYDKLAINFSNVIKNAAQAVTDFATNIKWKEYGQNVNEFFSNLDAKGMAQKISDALNSVIEGLLTFFETVDFSIITKKITEFVLNFDWLRLINNFNRLRKALGQAWDAVKNGVKEGIKQKLLEVIDNALEGVRKTLQNFLKEKFGINLELPKPSDIYNGIVNIYNKIKQFISNPIGTIKLNLPSWSDIKEKFNTIISNTKDKFSNALATIKLNLPKWSDVKERFNTLVSNTKNKFSNAIASVKLKLPSWSDFRDRWRNLMSKFSGKTIKIKMTFSAAASEIKSWINNNVIAKINRQIAKIPILRNHKIPYLAQGGYVKRNTPQLAMIGDNKHYGEIVAPENKLQAMADAAANGSSNSETNVLLRQLIAIVQNMNLNVELDGESIKNNTVARINRHTKATGKLELII